MVQYEAYWPQYNKIGGGHVKGQSVNIMNMNTEVVTSDCSQSATKSPVSAETILTTELFIAGHLG